MDQLPAFTAAPEPNRIYHCDAMTLLRAMKSESVHCIVTSPPYWGLRDYGVAGQMGLEPTYQEHIAALVILFREARRVLRSDGTLWLNYGDCYATSVNGRSAADTKAAGNDDRTFRDKPFSTVGGTLKPKDLCMLPHRLAIALQDDGWWVRSDIVWSKPNPMPESVSDRPTKAHEYIFLLSKSADYWYDAEAIAEVSIRAGEIVPLGEKSLSKGQAKGANIPASGNGLADSVTVKSTRNKRSVWEIATAPFAEAHFATFPPKLIEPCILAGCPEQTCAACGAPYMRVTERGERVQQHWAPGTQEKIDLAQGRHGATSVFNTGFTYQRNTIGFEPSCTCHADIAPGIVLDPFMGAGTTALVARAEGRQYIGSELSGDYVAIARDRLRLPFEARRVIKPEQPFADKVIGDEIQHSLFAAH